LHTTPHVAQNTRKHRSSAIDARTTRAAGYKISQRIRKRVEEIFGWFKTVGNFRKTRVSRGSERGRGERPALPNQTSSVRSARSMMKIPEAQP
jgi:hypothetical protein